MAKNLMDILIEQYSRKGKIFQELFFYAREIKKAAEEFLGKVKVFVFGSILRKK
jgi:predicted nucleotidyltransferase